MCELCKHVEPKLLLPQILVKSKKWNYYYKADIEVCIYYEIRVLVNAGVETLESYCGHGKTDPWCTIVADSHDRAVELGYEPVKESEGVYKIILRSKVRE